MDYNIPIFAIETDIAKPRDSLPGTASAAPTTKQIYSFWAPDFRGMSLMEIINFFLRYSRRTLIFSMIAGVASGLANAALLALINLTLKRTGSHSTVLMLGFLGLCLLLPAARFSAECLMNKTGQEAFYLLRSRLSQQILQTPLRHLEKLGSHRMLATLTEDVQSITTAIMIIPTLCINSALVLGCLFYMGLLSVSLLCTVLGFMVMGVLSYQLPIIKAQSVLRKSREQTDIMVGHIRGLIQGTKELKMHKIRRQAFLHDFLEKTASSVRDYNIAALQIYSAASSWGQTLAFLAVGLIIFVLVPFQRLDSSTIFAYTLTLLYLLPPLQFIMNSMPTLTQATVSLKQIKKLGLELGCTDTDAGCSYTLPHSNWEQLALHLVSHSYSRDGESANFILGPLTVTFRRGEMAFVTGGNGSGKTTFIKLLVGLYSPEVGTISLDGQLVTDANEDDYRQYFSVVFADFYLFEGLLGLSHLNSNSTEYLNRLKLSHKVQITNGTFSTSDLSQGQRKRLALLTACLEDRPIYVFDEWAAEQDSYFKDIFYFQLLPELKAKGKTVIVVTHDDRYFDVADRILKFDDGQLISDTAKLSSPPQSEIPGKISIENRKPG
jgi:putative ATP-binding cassette transporter